VTITVEPLIKDPPRKDTACTKGYFSTYEQSSWSRSVLYSEVPLLSRHYGVMSFMMLISTYPWYTFQVWSYSLS